MATVGEPETQYLEFIPLTAMVRDMIATAGFSVLFFYVSKYVERYNELQETIKGGFQLRNTQVSLIHSLVSGIWACAYLNTPLERYLTDEPSAKWLCRLFLGYTMYDFYDYIQEYINSKKKSRLSLLAIIVHHVLTSLTFGCAMAFGASVFSRKALLVEFNSIFLHARKVLRIYGYSTGVGYHINNILYFVTYFRFRFVVCSEIWYGFYIYRHRLPLFYFIIVWVANTFVFLLSGYATYVIFINDYIRGKKKETSSKVEDNS